MPSSTNSERPPGSAPAGGATERNDTILVTDSPGESARPQEPANPGEPPRTATYDPEAVRLAVLSARYDILSEAGHGSMGNVYKARDRETGEVVALKLLKPEIASDQTMMERFKNELLFARRITHKNVCRMYDFNRIDGIAYTSMEFVQGESLRSALNRFGGLAVRKALNVALQICSGLKEAHAQGIVHRDLKPENVMLDAQGNVKIMDFGIARSMEAATRLTGSMMGTPAYMAPEQVTGKAVDYRTDIYALGLILYEMFTGAQACQADTPVAAAMKQIRETPPLPHDIDPTIPVGIERTILKCLEKEPARRFQSVAELEKALSAPGVTGTSPGIPAAAVLATPTPLPSAISLPVPAKTSAMRSALASAPRARRASPALWVLFGAVLVVAALAGARWAKIVNTAKSILPPAAAPAPKPPAFAARTTRIEGTPVPSESAATAASLKPSKKTNVALTKKPVVASDAIRTTPAPLEAASKPPIDTEVFPRAERAVKKSARQIELEKTVSAGGQQQAPADVQQRADRAFRENPTASGDTAAERIVWVGRYERKKRADEIVSTIQALGVPVRTVVRHPWGKTFWVVLAGPFPAKRADGVTNWLKTQGYPGAHEFRVPPRSEQLGNKPE
jgi:serine/threonine protein kinase